jgi:hypothetical protein
LRAAAERPDTGSYQEERKIGDESRATGVPIMSPLL